MRLWEVRCQSLTLVQLSERESPRSMLHAPAPHDRYEDSFHITAIDNMIVSENYLEVSEYYSHHRALSARSCPPPRVAPRLHHATTLRLTPPDHTSPRPHTPERKHRYGHQAPPPPSGRPHRGYAFPPPPRAVRPAPCLPGTKKFPHHRRTRANTSPLVIIISTTRDRAIFSGLHTAARPHDRLASSQSKE